MYTRYFVQYSYAIFKTETENIPYVFRYIKN